ncbi:MAG: type II toxin-antitoxin system RelE/ParE family toxin [Actinomycetota bacterium]|nr:type II toxin-antitoxin system RelE/ParE family toxin [Actinomycetota bacterium]
MAIVRVELTRRATRDLRGLSPPDYRRAAQAITETLVSEPLPANADDRPLTGRSPWRRLRVGELRVIYRLLGADEVAGARGGRLVARIIHRGDLERAVATLP